MEYEPDDQEQVVLDVIRQEGRVNPMRVREQTEIRKQYVNDALKQLQKAGVIKKVNRGLYEHVPEVDDDYPSHEQQIRDAVANVRDAYEDVDGDRLGAALDELEALVEVNDE